MVLIYERLASCADIHQADSRLLSVYTVEGGSLLAAPIAEPSGSARFSITGTRGRSTLGAKAPSDSRKPGSTSKMDKAAQTSSLHQRHLGLFDLPQELLDLIFNLAYPRPFDDGTVCIARAPWERQERDKQRDNPAGYVARPFSPKVNDFLVCKLFFVNATRAWTGNQSFDYTTNCSSIFSDVGRGSLGGIVSGYVVDLRSAHWITENMYRLPCLKFLQLMIQPGIFEVIEPKYAWKEELTMADFEKVESSVQLTLLSGLKSIRLIPGRHRWVRTVEDRAMWSKNVQTLEDLVRPFVTRERSPQEVIRAEEEGRGMLYIGSRVKLDTGGGLIGARWEW